MFDPETPPELAVAGWLNTSEPLSLESLKGRVVILVAFQMLCPGCVEHAIPQAKRLRARFNSEQVAIVGLHSVFEHHHVMTPEALEVFVSEFKLPFPVAIDQPTGDGLPPRTMSAYQMQGTPTLLIFDRAGRLRRHYFGQPDDIMLAAEIMAMAIEDKGSPRNEASLIERKIAATLNNPSHDHADHDRHGHDHDHGEACGCGPDHDHEHHHHRVENPALTEDTARRLAGAERMTEPPHDAKGGR